MLTSNFFTYFRPLLVRKFPFLHPNKVFVHLFSNFSSEFYVSFSVSGCWLSRGTIARRTCFIRNPIFEFIHWVSQQNGHSGFLKWFLKLIYTETQKCILYQNNQASSSKSKKRSRKKVSQSMVPSEAKICLHSSNNLHKILKKSY